MGLDIGGTLTKIVIASKPGESPLASLAHTTSTQKVELAFDTAQASFHFLNFGVSNCFQEIRDLIAQSAVGELDVERTLVGRFDIAPYSDFSAK